MPFGGRAQRLFVGLVGFVDGLGRGRGGGRDGRQERGFGEVAKGYLPRLAAQAGVRRDIAENGDLLIRRACEPAIERIALLPALAQPSWLDPATGGPRR